MCVCAQPFRSTLLVSILQLPPCPGSAVAMASPLPAGVGQSLPSVQQVKDAAQTLIEQVDVQHTSSTEFRQKLATHFGLAPDGLEFMKDEFKSDREIVLRAVKSHGPALMFAANHLLSDREVVITAVKGFGLGLQFAADELRGDKAVVICAVKNQFRSVVLPKCFWGPGGIPTASCTL